MLLLGKAGAYLIITLYYNVNTQSKFKQVITSSL